MSAEHLHTTDPNTILTEVEQLTAPIFERMGQAEEEITAAMQSDPANADAYNSSFSLLLPTGTLVSESLYRHHCRELLARVVDGTDTRPGTDAEVLGAFSQASHVAPPNGELSLAYAQLFRRIYPDASEHADELEKSAGRERYEGSVDELIAQTRKKLTVKDRVKKEGE